ncbi:unnamed protein product, partial [Cylicocyclus nassatus]
MNFSSQTCHRKIAKRHTPVNYTWHRFPLTSVASTTLSKRRYEEIDIGPICSSSLINRSVSQRLRRRFPIEVNRLWSAFPVYCLEISGKCFKRTNNKNRSKLSCLVVWFIYRDFWFYLIASVNFF